MFPSRYFNCVSCNYNDVIMSAMTSQSTSLTIVYSSVYSGADQGKHQSSASLAFVRGIHRWPMNSPHKGPVTLKMLPFDDVIMSICDVCLMRVFWHSNGMSLSRMNKKNIGPQRTTILISGKAVGTMLCEVTVFKAICLTHLPNIFGNHYICKLIHGWDLNV